jgi:hypothetical protein
MPKAQKIPVVRSRNVTPARTGGPPGSPVMDMMPLKACISASWRRRPCGPVRPNADTEQYTSLGLIADSAS